MAAFVLLGGAAGCSSASGGGGGGAGTTSSSSSTGASSTSSTGASSSSGAAASSSSSGASSSSASSTSSASSSSSASSASSASSSASSASSSASSASSSSSGGSNGCGTGGKVAWTYTIQAPNPLAVSTTPVSIAGGPLGEVAVGTLDSAPSGGCAATAYVFDASGALASSVTIPSGSNGACLNSASPVMLDPKGGLLYGYEYQASTTVGTANSGFVGEAVSTQFMGTAGGGPIVYATLVGADNAGNFFVQATSSPPGTSVNYGLGPVSTTVMLHYDPTGKLVSQSLPVALGVAGSTAVAGALGNLFYATQVGGTVNDGCGTVGTTGTISTVLTERDATGACIWSKALPRSTLVALDASQDVLLATTFSGTIDFGGGPLTSVGTSDLAIAKLSPAGGFVWAKRFGAPGASVSAITALGATSAGGLALSASLGGAVDFGCGAVASSAGAAVVYASFDATGTVVYSRVVATAGQAVDSLGGISYTKQVPYQFNCACGPGLPPCPVPDTCTNGMCGPICQNPPPNAGNIQVTRFAP